MRTIRSVFRRKLRATLTIFGIGIGVLALVVMGSVAEKLQLLVDGGERYYADKVIISDGSTFAGFGMSPMSSVVAEEAEAIDGIERASVTLNFLLDDDVQMMSMGTPPMVEATDFRDLGVEDFTTTIARGRELRPEDTGKVVVGADLVDMLGAEVGGTVDIRGVPFEVVGIAEKTLTAPDSTVQMTLPDAQEIFLRTLPESIAETVEVSDLTTSVVLFPEDGRDPDDMVPVVAEALGGSYNVQGPAGFEQLVKEPLEIFNYLIYTVALIALVVGGLSIINTMTMSVSERTREIGIRKAIGATRGDIMRQFLAEAAVIGVIGGLLGLGLGAASVYTTMNSGVFGASGLFLLTPRLAVGSVLFALVLGVVAGIYPAWHASRLSPVEALRHE
ncbi:MAG: ABC transporter permease [Actinomycetales bacterium]|nr:ABC transporter permease [Actinomycetales bacterium]